MGDDKEILRSKSQKTIEISKQMTQKMGFETDQQKLNRRSILGPEEQKSKKAVGDKKVVPADQIKHLPVVGKMRPMTQEELQALRAVYNDQDKTGHMSALLKLLNKKEEEAPKDRNELVLLRSEFMQQVEIEENGKVKTDYDWAPGVNAELKEHINWLMEYFKINDDSIDVIIESNKQDAQEVVLPINNYDVSVKGLENIYEFQGRNTANCYCCAGTAMLNQFLTLKNNNQNQVQYFKQGELRKFRPPIKKYQDDYSFFAEKKQYDDYIREFDKYAGEGKKSVGNVFEVGDFFIDKLEHYNSMLNKMIFQMPRLDTNDKAKSDRIAHNMKAVFMDKVAEVLATGNVVNLLWTSGQSGHYVTITGIKGNTIEYLDSDLEENFNKVQTTTVDNVLYRLHGKNNQVEIEFISDMKTPEEMKQEFSDLEYSEQNGYTLKRLSDENVHHVGQTKGLAVKKNFADLGPGMDEIGHTVYIPNPKQVVATETIEQHEWMPKEEDSVETTTKKVEKTAEKKTTPETKTETKSVTKDETEDETETKVESARFIRPEQKAKETYVRPARERTEEEEEAHKDFVYKVKKDSEAFDQRLKRNLQSKQLKDKLENELSTDKKAAKEQIKKYEKDHGDYASFGVSFDLADVDINAGDSKHMRRVKNALADYLQKRKEIFSKRGLRELSARELYDGVDGHKTGDYLISNDTHGPGGISATEREVLGDAFDTLDSALKDYITERSSLFKTKRRKERLNQVKKLREQILLDDYRFKLNEDQRSLHKTVDEKYNYSKVNSWSQIRKGVMPTWQHAVEISQTIDVRNMAYRERRQRQRATDELPGAGKRFKEYMKIMGRNLLSRLGMAYNGIGGLFDRTLGAATMLAANTLELAGKVIKLPFKICSGIFNLGSWALGRKARWRMDYSLTKGWKSLDDGRKIFRRYLKGACIIPAAVVETVVRGLGTAGGHYYKHGIYKRTRRWSKDILNDVKNVFGSLVSKKYEIAQRGLEDVKMAGGYLFDENMNAHFTSGYTTDEGDLEEGETSETESVSEEEESRIEEIQRQNSAEDIQEEKIQEETSAKEEEHQVEEKKVEEIKEEEQKEDKVEEFKEEKKEENKSEETNINKIVEETIEETTEETVEQEEQEEDQEQKQKELTRQKEEKQSAKEQAALDEELKLIDDLYKGSGIPAADLKQVKESAIAKANIIKANERALSHEINEEIENGSLKDVSGVDLRGFKLFLRPVQVNKDGQPLTEQDKKKRELNIRDYEGYKTRTLSGRKDHLDYIANDIMKDMFTSKQLDDPEFIRANKERAIRFLGRLHYMDDLIGYHLKYYMTQADPKIRVFAFLLKGTFYMNYVPQKVSAALYSYGYGNAVFGSSTQYGDGIPYIKGNNYKKTKKENDRIHEGTYMETAAYSTVYSTMLQSGESPFSQATQKMIEMTMDDSINTVKPYALSGAKKYRWPNVPKKGADLHKLIDDTIRVVDEFIAKKDDKNYIDKMMKQVNGYVQFEGKNLSNVTRLKDDLSK